MLTSSTAATASKQLINRTSLHFAKATTCPQSRKLSTTLAAKGLTLLQDKENGFGFARSNPRPVKPRSKGVTEIRGPYYSVCIDPFLVIDND